jgi:peptide/nickel transport system ATP-binding protein
MDNRTLTAERESAIDPSQLLLSIRNLSIGVAEYPDAPLVDSVYLDVLRGETVGLVGESGSGKSLTCMAALNLLPSSLVVGGEILLGGEDVRTMSARRLREVRGTKAAMIFQEPMSSLNPVLTVKQQLFEALREPKYSTTGDKRRRAIELLDLVGINQPERRLSQYPHEFSGGMCQRIMIAIAMAGDPEVLIADEPTTGLDVTIQAQVLQLLKDLTAQLGMAMLLVSHDLGVIAQNCDRVCVMYAGRIVEQGPVDSIFTSPTHPYTEGLLQSLPSIDGVWHRLPSLPGSVPTVTSMPSGCRYNPRCPLRVGRCSAEVPPLLEIADAHAVSCWVRGRES